MSLTHLLDELDAASVQIWLQNGELRFRAPKGALSGELRDRVVASKPDLLRRLASAAPDAHRFEPFAQTPIQQAYLIGRTEALAHGGVAANSYIEFRTGEIDLTRAETLFNDMIAQHDMLRTVLIDDGQQQVLREVPQYKLQVHDLRHLSTAGQEVAHADIRAEMSGKLRDPMCWPLFEICATVTHDEVRLHSCVDLIILDAWSTKLFFEEWFARIAGQDVPDAPRLRFRDCKTAHSPDEVAQDRDYWAPVLDVLPDAPALPPPWPTPPQDRGAYQRFSAHVDAADWQAFSALCKSYRVTPTSALVTLFANCLSCWSAQEDVALNLTLFNRPQTHPDIGRVLGEFTNTTLLGFSGMDRSLIEQIQETQSQLLERLEHSRISGVDLLRDLARKRGDLSSSPMPVVFTSLLIGDEDGERNTGDWEHIYGISQTPQVTLDHQLFRDRGGLSFNWDIAVAAIDPHAAEAAFETYAAMIRRLAHNAELWNTAPDRSPPPSQMKPRARMHHPSGSLPDSHLSAGFWSQLMQTSDAPAVLWSGGSLSYEELARAAVGLANRLTATGVCAQDRVVIALDKGPEQIVAVLATLYVGAVYVPVDPIQPIARLKTILEQTDPAATLAATPLGLGNVPGVILATDDPIATGDLADLAHGCHANDPSALAYILFTSGTTGIPKGVCMAHGPVLNTLLDVQNRFDLTAHDRVLGISALTFDLSVYDIFATLGTGAALVLPDKDRLRDPAHWWDMIRQYEVSIWNSVPAFLQMLLGWMINEKHQMPASLRLTLASGDWVPLDLGDALRAVGSSARLVGLGGATEAAIWSNWQDVTSRQDHWVSLPYGRPLRHQFYRVRDKYGAERPDLVPGMLYIGGLGLADAYWRDPETTARAFAQDSGERLYKTGDYGRFWPDLNLEFLGRKDQQIKRAGHRIELGEISHALERHPAVTQAIAVLRDNRLLAYAQAAAGTEAEFKHHLAEQLPHYMQPDRVITLKALPLSANGKVDRNQLPEPAQTPSGSNTKSGIAHTVLSEILGTRRLDLTRNFFELGLSSVDLVTAHGMLSDRLPHPVPVADLFIHTTVKTLQAHLDDLAAHHSQKAAS